MLVGWGGGKGASSAGRHLLYCGGNANSVAELGAPGGDACCWSRRDTGV